jgi:hypothetical protein
MDAPYDHVNEGLSALKHSLQDKLDEMNELVGKDNGRVLELGGPLMCPDGTDAQECVDRLERQIELLATRIDASIITNDTSNASLRSKLKEPDGRLRGDDSPRAAQITLPAGSPPPSPRSQLPYLPSYSELKEEYKKDQKDIAYSIVNDEAFNDSIANYGRMPTCDDFPKFKRIYRNPDNPSEGTFNVALKKADGVTNQCDQDALKAAVEAYQKAHGRQEGLEDDMNAIVQARKDLLKHDKNALQKLYPKTLDDPRLKVETEEFKKRRAQQIACIQQQIQGTGRRSVKDASKKTDCRSLLPAKLTGDEEIKAPPNESISIDRSLQEDRDRRIYEMQTSNAIGGLDASKVKAPPAKNGGLQQQQ